jgi:anti-anti-sigma factor
MPNTLAHAEESKSGGMHIGARTVLSPENSITHENRDEFKQKIENAVQQNKTEIILDCKHVDLLDSAALEFLVQTHAELRSKGGALKIVGLNEVCRDILLATRIINVLFVYKDIHDAITSMP